MVQGGSDVLPELETTLRPASSTALPSRWIVAADDVDPVVPEKCTAPLLAVALPTKPEYSDIVAFVLETLSFKDPLLVEISHCCASTSPSAVTLLHVE